MFCPPWLETSNFDDVFLDAQTNAHAQKCEPAPSRSPSGNPPPSALHPHAPHRLSTQEKAEGKIAEAVDLGTFCHGLLAEFTLVEQLTALSRLIPALYPDVDMGAVSKVFQTLEGADAPRTCEHGLRVKVLRFIAGHLQTPGFIEAVEKQIIFVPAAGKGDAGQRSVISDALVETFVTITLSFDFVERLAAKGAPAAEVQDTVDASRSVLRALNYLADLPAFISTLHMLLVCPGAAPGARSELLSHEN